MDSAQVELALSGLDRHKATIDIPNYLIKIASNLLSTPLTNVFNESIESGIVPDIFKISKVTPVFKTGAVTDPGNYRPIAVLSPFAKILERLVYNQLNRFLAKSFPSKTLYNLKNTNLASEKIILLSKQLLNSLTILK